MLLQWKEFLRVRTIETLFFEQRCSLTCFAGEYCPIRAFAESSKLASTSYCLMLILLMDKTYSYTFFSGRSYLEVVCLRIRIKMVSVIFPETIKSESYSSSVVKTFYSLFLNFRFFLNITDKPPSSPTNVRQPCHCIFPLK